MRFLRGRQARLVVAGAIVVIAIVGTAAALRGRREPAARSAQALATATATPGVATIAPAPAAIESAPCGWRAAPPARWKHVIWVFMENKPFGEVIGSPEAPYVNAIASRCGLATSYHNITHHSLANYIAATSGLSLADLQPFRGDCVPSPTCGSDAANIFTQLPDARSYIESMPGRCVRTNGGLYGTRHNPLIYYRNVADCAARDVWLGQFWQDLHADSLPSFSFVAPDLCHDTHDCSVRTGDAWLHDFLQGIAASPVYQAGDTAVLLTWDEGEPEVASDCAAARDDPGCHIPLVVMSPSTPAGTRVGDVFNHYSLLRTLEEMLGATPLLGEAAHAASMRAAFHL